MVKLLDIFGLSDKPIFKSITAWGLVIFVMGEAGVATLCGSPELTFGGTFTTNSAFCDLANTILAKAGMVLTALGVRKAAKNG